MGRVMIVEDNILIALGLEKIVKSIDHSLEIYKSGYAREALSYATENIVDLFLLDIQLFDYSGLDLAKKIRELSIYKLTPIVFITSIPTNEMIAFRQIHCYDFIIKPFTNKGVRDSIFTIIKHGINSDKENKTIRFTQKKYTISLNPDDIIYIESANRKLKVVTLKESIIISTYTLAKIKNNLPLSFVRCHRSYIVNTMFVERIDKTRNLAILHANYGEIPVGPNYSKFIRSECL